MVRRIKTEPGPMYLTPEACYNSPYHSSGSTSYGTSYNNHTNNNVGQFANIDGKPGKARRPYLKSYLKELKELKELTPKDLENDSVDSELLDEELVALQEEEVLTSRQKLVKYLQSNPVQVLLCVVVLLDAGIVIAQILLDLHSVRAKYGRSEVDLTKLLTYIHRTHADSLHGYEGRNVDYILQMLNDHELYDNWENNSTVTSNEQKPGKSDHRTIRKRMVNDSEPGDLPTSPSIQYRSETRSSNKHHQPLKSFTSNFIASDKKELNPHARYYRAVNNTANDSDAVQKSNMQTSDRVPSHIVMESQSSGVYASGYIDDNKLYENKDIMHDETVVTSADLSRPLVKRDIPSRASKTEYLKDYQDNHESKRGSSSSSNANGDQVMSDSGTTSESCHDCFLRHQVFHQDGVIPEHHMVDVQEDDHLHEVAHALHFASIALLGFLFLEDIVKILAMGKEFFKHKVEMFDATIISFSFIFDVILLNGVMGEEGEKAAAVLVVLLLWRITRVVDGIMITAKQRHEFRVKLQKRARRKAEKVIDRMEVDRHDKLKQINALKELCTKAGVLDDAIELCTPKQRRVSNTINALSSVARLSVSMTMSMSSSLYNLGLVKGLPTQTDESDPSQWSAIKSPSKKPSLKRPSSTASSVSSHSGILNLEETGVSSQRRHSVPLVLSQFDDMDTIAPPFHRNELGSPINSSGIRIIIDEGSDSEDEVQMRGKTILNGGDIHADETDNYVKSIPDKANKNSTAKCETVVADINHSRTNTENYHEEAPVTFSLPDTYEREDNIELEAIEPAPPSPEDPMADRLDATGSEVPLLL